MAITFPRTDILTAVAFSDQTFQLKSRQELSTQSNGVVRGKDFGSAIWVASYTTIPLGIDDAVPFEAALNSLDGVIFAFEAWDLRRPSPKAYPTGAFSDSGVLNTVNSNNKALSLAGLPASQIITAGDYLSFTYAGSRALHQAVESVTANGSGTTAEFEVRPHLRPGWTLGQAVVLANPKGQFALMPDTVTSKLNGPINSVVSFQAIQYLA